jgi:hypothetical protein
MLIGWLTGGGASGLAEELRRAYAARLAAETDDARIEADKLIAQIEAARQIAAIQAHDRWSATRIGGLGIVLPFCAWWAAIYLVQIVNGFFGTSFVVYDVPQHITDQANVLVPLIVVGTVAERFGIGRR